MWQEVIVVSTLEFSERVRANDVVCMHCGNIQDTLDDQCGLCNSTHLLSFSEFAAIGIVEIDEEMEVA